MLVVRDRKYFVSTFYWYYEESKSYLQGLKKLYSWPHENCKYEIDFLKIGEMYYDTCAMVDRHNLGRQDYLHLEK